MSAQKPYPLLAHEAFRERADTEIEVAYALTLLAMYHAGANLPDEPYSGVTGLFNGDLHATDPSWAPRHHWEVVSAYEIRHRPIKQILAEERKAKKDKEEK